MTRLSRQLGTRDPVQQLAETLRRSMPFPSDYCRNDTSSYEEYRTAAINCLRSQHSLNSITANAVVDDAIAGHERMCGMRTKGAGHD